MAVTSKPARVTTRWAWWEQTQEIDEMFAWCRDHFGYYQVVDQDWGPGDRLCIEFANEQEALLFQLKWL